MVDSGQNEMEQPVATGCDQVQRETRKVLILQIARQIVAVGAAAALYRLLGPEPFGLYGMVIPLLMLPRMAATLGLSTAAVQSENLSLSQRSGVFHMTLLLGVAATLLTGGLGHLFSRIFQVPELIWISWTFAGTTLVDTLGLTHLAGLQREMKLGRIAAIRLAGQIAAAVVSVAVAMQVKQEVLTAGILALVAMEYAQISLNTLGYWFFGRWRPGRFVKADIKQLLAFSGNYSLSSLVFYAGQNLDKVLLAVIFGSTQTGQRLLGMYTAMYNLMMKPVYFVTDPVTSVMLPSLSRTRKKAKDYYRIATDFYRFTAILLMPAGIGLTVVSTDVAQLISGPNWDEAAVMLFALAPAICVHGLINISGSLLASAGQTGKLLAAAFILLGLQAQGYGAAYWFANYFEFGPDVSVADAVSVAVAASYSIVLIFITIPYLIFCFSRVGLLAGPLLLDFVQILSRSLLMGVLVWFIQDLMVKAEWSLYIRLPIAISIGVTAYAVLMWSRIQQSVMPFLKRGHEVTL
ncbi:MAG: hypothetical protein CMJ76_05120 [Planctomycetaceae bacterium]|nr:hypothetical protein [Planctomycetaceae bacterium]|tara:strand:+ start:704 stop:2263 length:1560 start_codon:yes stop_codon:yes gene_type:complete